MQDTSHESIVFGLLVYIFSLLTFQVTMTKLP
jgi:hypothetical protein